jgi:hypothetical protein
MEEEPNTL